MSDSSKKHGSSPGIDFKAELKALRHAWKRGKAVDPEAEARLVKGFVSETVVKWISFVDFETRKKAGDSDVSQEQKDRFIAVAAGAAMKPRAERIRELAAAYFSPADYLFPISHFPQKLPIPFKEIRRELSIKETLKLFSHALTEHNPNKEYIDEAVSLAEFILAQTKAPPSAKFVAGFGSSKRITNFLHAAGAETANVSWAANYLLQSISQIEKSEKQSDSIANILFISEKNVGKLASPNCVHTPMYEAVLSSFSELMAQGNTHLPVITIQAKIRNLAKKEPKDSSIHEFGLKFRERVYSLSPPWKDELRKEGHETGTQEKAGLQATTLLMGTPLDEADPLEQLEPLPETEELPVVSDTAEPSEPNAEPEPEEVLPEPEAGHEDEQPQTLSPAELVEAFKTGRDIKEAEVDYADQPWYTVIDSAFRLSELHIIDGPEKATLESKRRKLVVSLLFNIKEAEDALALVVGLKGQDLKKVITEILSHPAVKEKITEYITNELRNDEVTASERSGMMDNLFSWYGDGTAVPLLAEAAVSIALSQEEYPRETIHHIIGKIMVANNQTSGQWDDELEWTMSRISNWDQDISDLRDLEKRMQDANPAVLVNVLGDLSSFWNGMEWGHAFSPRVEELIEHCEDQLKASDSNIAERRARKVLPVLETTENFGVVGHIANYLSNMNIHNNIVWNLEDKELVERILEAAEKQSEKQDGPSNTGDRLYMLKQSCEERIAKLSNVDELIGKLDDNTPSIIIFAFGELMKRSEGNKFTKDEAQLLLDRLEERIRAASLEGGVLTYENIEKVKELCRERIEQEETKAEPAGLFHVPGIGLVTREQLEAMEWKPLGSVSAEENMEEPEEAKESAIFAKYDEAEPLLDEMLSAESEDEAREAYMHLSNLFSPEPEDLPFEDMVLEFADLAINPINQVLATKTKGVNALFSLSFTFPELSASNSSMLVANLMRVPSGVSNQVIADTLLESSESEIDLALALLAERAREGEFALDSLGRSRPTHALAAEEIATTFTTRVAADILFSISNEHIQPKYLVPALEDIYSENPVRVQGLVLDMLLGRRAQEENSLFTSEEKPTIQQALLAEEFLFALGEEAKTREATIASGLSQLEGEKAAMFAIQRMEDVQEDEAGIAAWAEVLTTLEGEAVDELLIDNFTEMGEATQSTAISIMAAREPFPQKAEFLFNLSSESGKAAAEAGTALAEMNFSSFDKMNEFGLLYGMRHHPNQIVAGAAGERLQQFLSENNKLLSPAQAVALSNLARSDEDSAVKEYAKSVLLGSAAEMLRTEYSLVTRTFVGALEDATEISVLATYALAKEMQKPFSNELAAQIGKALIKFEEHTDDLSHLRMLYAAKVSENQDYIEQIIVPSLASKDSISQEASDHLYELGSKGIAIAARAAKRENIPEVLTQEMQKRISDKAIDVLCRANAFNEVVPMLGHENKAIRLNIRRFLEQSPDTEEKSNALLAGLNSKDVQVRFASLDLLPNEDAHAEEILLLVGDSSATVSQLAAERVSKLPGMAEEYTLAKFFITEEIPEHTRQKVADVLLENSETVIASIASQLQESEQLPKAMMFFQSVGTFDYFFNFGKTTDEAKREILEDALDYFCQSLAGSTIAASKPTQEKMLLLLNMCTIFNQEKVHEAARAAAEGKDAELLLNAARESEDAEVLFAAAELFISLKDENRAVQAALAFRKLANTDLHVKLAEPYQKVLFGRDHSEVNSVASPLEDPSVDPLPYRLVKQVAFEEFVRGQGTSASSDLFFNFGEQFEDIESLFDYGLDAVSELIWTGNALGSDAAAMAKTLPAHVDDSIQGETELLAKVLVLRKHEYLAEAKDTSTMGHIIKHAHRRLEQVTQNSDLSESDAKNKLTLLAELLERNMIEEDSLNLSDPGLTLLATVRQEIRGSFQHLAAQFRESRGRILSSEEVTSAQALADARKIEAKRPSAGPSKRQPGAKQEPGKIPRGEGSGPNK